MKNLDLIDFERGAKVAGAKFYFLKNEAVFLEQALVNYALEVCRQEGFSPFVTPDLAKDEVLLGIGYNPRGEETQVYSIEKTDLNLVGTAEITMGGYHKDEAIDEKDLPLKYVALSHCFRTEAGSYGRHSAGLFRVRQCQLVHGLQDVPATAIVGGDGQRQCIIIGSKLLGFLHHLPKLVAEAAAVADDFQADVVLMQTGNLALQHFQEQQHQEGNFVGGTPPVFAAEREHGQILHTQLAAAFHHLAQRFHPAGHKAR